MSITIKSRLMGKSGIDGFEVMDEDYNVKLLKYNDIITLVKNGQISDWEVLQDEDGNYHLYSDKISLEGLPETIIGESETAVISRINNESGETIGFICQTSSGNKQNLRKEKIWQMAKANNLLNVKAYYSKDKTARILVGTQHSLNKLPIIVKKS